MFFSAFLGFWLGSRGIKNPWCFAWLSLLLPEQQAMEDEGWSSWHCAAAASLAVLDRTSFAQYCLSTECTSDPQILRCLLHTHKHHMMRLASFRFFGTFRRRSPRTRPLSIRIAPPPTPPTNKWLFLRVFCCF